MREVYAEQLDQVHEGNSGKELKVNGDGRFSSPGHTALYGTYTLMDSQSSKIVACEMVKVGHCS